MPTELTSDEIFEKKVKKSSKIGKDFKSSIFNSACFLTAIVKISFLEGRLNTRPFLEQNLGFFNIF